MSSDGMRALIICLLAAAMTICLTGCSDNATEPEPYWFYLAVPVDSIAVGQVNGSGAGFIARVGWRNACGEFSHNVITRDGNTFTVTVIGKEYISPATACAQVETSFSAPVSVPLPGPGTYTFRFWRTDSTTLDTTLTAP